MTAITSDWIAVPPATPDPARPPVYEPIPGIRPDREHYTGAELAVLDDSTPGFPYNRVAAHLGIPNTWESLYNHGVVVPTTVFEIDTWQLTEAGREDWQTVREAQARNSKFHQRLERRRAELAQQREAQP
jgi:hypothetical protein